MCARISLTGIITHSLSTLHNKIFEIINTTASGDYRILTTGARVARNFDSFGSLRSNEKIDIHR